MSPNYTTVTYTRVWKCPRQGWRAHSLSGGMEDISERNKRRLAGVKAQGTSVHRGTAESHSLPSKLPAVQRGPPHPLVLCQEPRAWSVPPKGCNQQHWHSLICSFPAPPHPNPQNKSHGSSSNQHESCTLSPAKNKVIATSVSRFNFRYLSSVQR